MILTNTSNTTTTGSAGAGLMTQGVRTPGASAAQGFAQILHGFERTPARPEQASPSPSDAAQPAPADKSEDASEHQNDPATEAEPLAEDVGEATTPDATQGQNLNQRQEDPAPTQPVKDDGASAGDDADAQVGIQPEDGAEDETPVVVPEQAGGEDQPQLQPDTHGRAAGQAPDSSEHGGERPLGGQQAGEGTQAEPAARPVAADAGEEPRVVEHQGPGHARPRRSGQQAAARAEANAQGAPVDASGASPDAQRDASLRLLENQGEQAKLSIKGLVRNLTQSAGADLTTIAVDTRLGRGEASDPPPHLAKPEPSQPSPKPSGSAVGEASRPATPGSDGDAPPEQARTQGVARDAVVRTNTTSSAEPRPDQSGARAQQVLSTRADAAARVSNSAQPRSAATGHTQGGVAQAISSLTGATGAQTVRAVTQAGAAQIQAGPREQSPSASLDRASGAAKAQGADRASVMAQVQRGLASLLRSGKGEMTLKLTPGHLGEVKIRVRSEGDRLSVRFQAASDEAGDLLRSGAKELATTLRGKGVRLEQLSVEQRPAQDASQANQAQHAFDNAGSDDASPRQDNQQGGQQHAAQGRQRGVADGVDADDDAPVQQHPTPVWTELGLDAIA